MRLILLPGLALDERLFEPQRALPFRFEVPPWPRTRDGDSLEGYAARLAEKIGFADAIAGVSFGGMLAQAMASRLKPRVVIGIGTARRGRDVPGILRFTETILRQVRTLRLHWGRAVIDLGLLGPLKEGHRQLVLEMIRDGSIALMREGARMILEWPGSEVSCPTYFIHGTGDLLIRPRSVRPDRVIRGGGHLINLTHPRTVNSYIEECLKKEALT